MLFAGSVSRPRLPWVGLPTAALLLFGLLVGSVWTGRSARAESTQAETGLVSYWTGDGTAQDLAGGNHGTLKGGTIYGLAIHGTGFNFDGIDDGVEIPDAANLKLTKSLTVSAWIFPRAIQPGQIRAEIFFRGDDRNGFDPYSLALVNDQLIFLIESQTASASLSVPISFGRFQHVAGTLDDATGQMRLYVDGRIVAQQNTQVRPLGDLNQAFFPGVGIGNHPHQPASPHDHPFNGIIDEVKVYSRARTSDEIGDDYGAGIAGGLLVTAFEGQRVARFDKETGTFLDIVTSSQMDHPSGLAFGPDGNLYVGSLGNDRVLRFRGTTGQFMDTFVAAGSGGLDGPEAVQFGPDGNLYVASRYTGQVLRYDGQTGAFIDVFAAAAGLVEPFDMTFGPDCDLFVGNRGNGSVYRFHHRTGAFLGAFIPAGTGGLQADEPRGLTFGPDNNLYVAAPRTDRVLRFSGASGAFIGNFVTPGTGGLDEPCGIRFGPDNRLYVTSTTTSDVKRFDNAGASLGVFASGGGLAEATFLTFSPGAVTNRAPVAHAGPDLHLGWHGEPVPVLLDARDSCDPDGDALTYEWRDSNTIIGTGVTLGVTMGPGLHPIQLSVRDPAGATSIDTLEVTVARITVTSPNGGETWAPSSSHAITWDSADVLGNVKLEYTTDGTTWNTIADSTENDGSYPWTVPATASTFVRVRITEIGQPDVTDTSDSAFTIAAMAITVTSPNGGEVWAPHSTHTITWSSLNVVDPVRVEYSPNNGTNWFVIASNTADDGEEQWLVPNIISNQARVRVRSVNSAALSDISNGVFTIGIPSYALVDPNGGEIWTGGTTETISWTSANVTGSVKLEYSTDNGATWTVITASTANDGSEPWTVANTASSQARIRISSVADPSVSDTSDQPFRISVPTVTLTNPAGGELWAAGSPHTLTWTSSDIAGGMKLEYSTDNGATWSLIAGFTANDGSHDWTVPAVPTSQGRIRITALATPSAADTNDAPISVFLGTLNILSPNGGETWAGGTSHAITWTSTGLIDAVKLEYTVDGGSNWTPIAASSPNDGNQLWTVPSVVTEQARIRISAVSSPGESDLSDSLFAIAGSALSLTSPNGGETWDSRSTHAITWTSANAGSDVKLEYSADGGATWNTIVATTPNDGLHSWVVPDGVTTQARVRISEVGGIASDTSDANFTVRYVGGILKAPAKVKFGTVKLGKTKTVTVTLNNTHRSEGLIVSLAVTGAGFQLSSGAGPTTIPARKKLQVQVRYTPAAPGGSSGQLVITSSDRNRPTATVVLSGSGK